MKEEDSNVKNFKQDFKEADIESGAQDKIAEWYVNWSQRFAKSIVKHEGTLILCGNLYELVIISCLRTNILFYLEFLLITFRNTLHDPFPFHVVNYK